jgi:hypothetical protein
MKMTKRFDCVDMMHGGARGIYEDSKDLTREEELEYWRQKTAQLRPDDANQQKDSAATRRGCRTHRNKP